MSTLLFKSFFNRKNKIYLIITIFILTFFLTNKQFQPTNVRAHSSVANPKEIFSIWNNTAPTIDGGILFTPYSLSGEWSSAAVFDLYDITNAAKGKLLLQNDNTTLYIGLDCTTFTTEYPITDWGAKVYLDMDHDGLLSSNDYMVKYSYSGGTELVELYSYNIALKNWMVLESGSPGSPLPSSGIIADTDFKKTAFNNVTSHRQYEFKIPYGVPITNYIIGAAFEATTNLASFSKSITWPYSEAGVKYFPINAGLWGDLHLGEKMQFEKYIIEDNFNIKSGAVGDYNNTVVALADIQGDGDQELVVTSNRQVAGDENLIAIYDYIDGKITRIWASWLSTQYSKLFHITGIAAYDFDEDGMDELYGVGYSDSRIGRLSGWNDITKDFDSAEIIFDNYGDYLLGYIAIGDVLNNFDNTAEIVFGDETGWLGFLTYNDKKDIFNLDHYLEPYGTPYRIHDLEVADMDFDGWSELLFFSQYTADNTYSYTNFSIYEYYSPLSKWVDNWDMEDNLPINSAISTRDQYGHTIVVDDVDNDGWVETIIVGKNYVKIFTPFSFDQTSPPIEFSINDGTYPALGGGAAVIDIDDDSLNELIIGCSNGTVIVYEFEDTTYDSEYIPNYTIEWKGDLGASPGIKNSIIGYDIDKDGRTEAIIGDHYGQILVLGTGNIPDVSFKSPSMGFISNRENILVKWSPSNESNQMLYYEIYINGFLEVRAGGGQLGAFVSLDMGSNDIEIFAYDITGNVAYDYLYVEYSQSAPEISIYSPSNYYATHLDNVRVEYTAFDPDADDLTFDIYVNGTIQRTVTDLYVDVELKIMGITGDGYYNITIVARDPSMNIGKDTIWIIRDATKPIIEITSPADGSAVKVSTIDLTWTASDALTGIDYFEIYRDGVYQGNTTLRYFSVGLPSDKKYILKVIAFDEVGNQQEDIIAITRDTINPFVDLTALSLPIQSGWYYTDDPTQFISWTGHDNTGGSGLDHFEIRINDEFYASYSSDILNDTIDFGVDGFKDVVIRVWDKAGNQAFDYYTIAIDTANPIVNILSPYNNYVTSGDSVIITWDAYDMGTGIKEQIVYVNGSIIDTLDSSTFYYELPILENTTYEITIRAVDYMNRFTEDTINVTQNVFAPTFLILNPFDYESFIHTTLLNLTWYAFNLIADEFHVYINGTLYPYDSSTFSTIIDLNDDFGPFSTSDYPVFNVTISVLIGGIYPFSDTCWITLDQTTPSLAILDPSNLDVILEESLYVAWSGYDAGSGIAYYIILIDDEIVGTFGSGITNQYLNVSGYDDGWHTLQIQAFDAAGNNISKSIDIEIYPQAPEFNVNLPLTYITNEPNFNVNLNIFDPRMGVSEIQVVADSSVDVFSIDYGTNYQVDPYSLDIAVNEDVFIGAGDLHNITITVYDKVDRGRYLILTIIIDQTSPVIYGNTIIDFSVLSPISNSLQLNDPGQNNHTFTISARDTYGIHSIDINIYGNDFNDVYQMTFDSDQSVGDIYVFTATINFDSYTKGNYSLKFIVEDNAGNAMETIFLLEIELDDGEPSNTNWLLDHLYTVVIPSASGIVFIILLSTILSVATKKRRINKGWFEALQAVAYVTKTGLTLAFVPYSKDLFEDEQLFGGAMTGIVSILGEITGETSTEMKTHTLEYGDKQLIITMGYFGNAIILVNQVKPKLKELLSKFLMEFELTYKRQLASELIDLNDFSAVNLMVEGIFGVRKNIFHEPSVEHYFEQAQQTYQEPTTQETTYQDTTQQESSTQEPTDNYYQNENYDQTNNQNDNTNRDDYQEY
ncbi:MAG TPA: Ig-like domain-containing protein [Candidatus Bathyarchaeia archaeon]|nr:Ig-like domain-containing protein [Candidatus Bathyarchaeia archaeon]